FISLILGPNKFHLTKSVLRIISPPNSQARSSTIALKKSSLLAETLSTYWLTLVGHTSAEKALSRTFDSASLAAWVGTPLISFSVSAYINKISAYRIIGQLTPVYCAVCKSPPIGGFIQDFRHLVGRNSVPPAEIKRCTSTAPEAPY